MHRPTRGSHPEPHHLTLKRNAMYPIHVLPENKKMKKRRKRKKKYLKISFYALPQGGYCTLVNCIILYAVWMCCVRSPFRTRFYFPFVCWMETKCVVFYFSSSAKQHEFSDRTKPQHRNGIEKCRTIMVKHQWNTLGCSFFFHLYFLFSGNPFVLDRFRVEMVAAPAKSNNKDVSMDGGWGAIFEMRGSRCLWSGDGDFFFLIVVCEDCGIADWVRGFFFGSIGGIVRFGSRFDEVQYRKLTSIHRL